VFQVLFVSAVTKKENNLDLIRSLRLPLC
jgi:hypothetical protein